MIHLSSLSDPHLSFQIPNAPLPFPHLFMPTADGSSKGQNKGQVNFLSVPRLEARFKKDLGHLLPCVSLFMGGLAMQSVYRLCLGHPDSTAWMLAVSGNEGGCVIPAAITETRISAS